MTVSPPSISNGDRWLLPVGVEETLPEDAAQIESLRRQALDLLDTWGYDLVMPPLMEYLDSLLTGAGRGLEIETFKITDQLSGKMMGVRADMTPQVARIDAHYLKTEGANRLCYFGPVLRTRQGCLSCSRVPLQLGAELFGVKSFHADVEIVELLVETLLKMGLEELHIDLGHVGIFQALAATENLDKHTQGQLIEAISTRAGDDVARICKSMNISSSLTESFVLLTNSSGEVGSLSSIAEKFSSTGIAVTDAFDNLSNIASTLKQRMPSSRLYYDLAQLKGKSYHNGLVFSVYTPGSGRAIANGGRYDDIGIEFGRARAATGFSLDLRAVTGLIEQTVADKENKAEIIHAPDETDPELQSAVKKLRAEGKRVVYSYEGAPISSKTPKLVKQNSHWVLD